MSNSLNDRQRKFCQLLVQGMPASNAYVQAGYKPRGAEANASHLIRNHKVKAEIERLRAEAEEKATVNRDRGIEILSAMAEQAMGKPGKIEALRELAKILGWYTPEKSLHEVKVVIGGDAD